MLFNFYYLVISILFIYTINKYIIVNDSVHFSTFDVMIWLRSHKLTHHKSFMFGNLKINLLFTVQLLSLKSENILTLTPDKHFLQACMSPGPMAPGRRQCYRLKKPVTKAEPTQN